MTPIGGGVYDKSNADCGSLYPRHLTKETYERDYKLLFFSNFLRKFLMLLKPLTESHDPQLECPHLRQVDLPRPPPALFEVPHLWQIHIVYGVDELVVWVCGFGLC
jgi:hypothetical protein